MQLTKDGTKFTRGEFTPGQYVRIKQVMGPVDVDLIHVDDFRYVGRVGGRYVLEAVQSVVHDGDRVYIDGRGYPLGSKIRAIIGTGER